MYEENLTTISAGSLRLGDLVLVPGHPVLSLRGACSLPVEQTRLAQMLLLGDLELVLLVPVAGGQLKVLMPYSSPPPGVSTARGLAAGILRFWAPHLPASSGGAAELRFELSMLRSSMSYLVMLDRGPDRTFFVESGTLDTARIKLQRSPRYAGAMDRRRHTAEVLSVSPMFDAAPSRARPLPRTASPRR